MSANISPILECSQAEVAYIVTSPPPLYKFIPLISLDTDYQGDHKSNNKETGGFKIIDGTKDITLDSNIDSTKRKIKVPTIQYNTETIIGFKIDKGNNEAKQDKGIIIAKIKNGFFIHEKKTIDEITLEVKYTWKVRLKLAYIGLKKNASIEFYTKDKKTSTNEILCGKVLLSGPTEKVCYSISILNETHYRSEKLHLFTPNPIPFINNDNAGIKDLIEILSQEKEETPGKKKYIAKKMIHFIALFSHGTPHRIFGDYVSIKQDELQQIKKYINNGSICFSSNALIYLGACNAGTNSDNKHSFAQELANVTGATVIGMYKDGVAPESETRPKLIARPKYGNKPEQKFYKFTPNAEPIAYERKIDIVKLFNEHYKK